MQKPLWNDVKVFDINTERRSGAGFPLTGKVISLDGMWNFLFCQSVYDAPKFFYKTDADLSCYSEIEVPSEWQIKGYDTPIYSNTAYPYAIESKKISKIPFIYGEKNSVGLYVRDFEIENADGQNIYINFGGINSAGEVYVNGNFVGFSADTFSETEYDITDFVKEGKNRLAVKVYRYTAASYLEDQDMWRLSGIFRSVNLIYKPRVQIRDFFARCKLNADIKSAVFMFEAEIQAKRREYKGGTLSLTIDDAEGKRIAEKTVEAAALADGANAKTGRVNIDVTGITAWSHENPYLYDVTFTLRENDIIIDARKQKFGFRSIEISPIKDGRGPFILLNGKPLKICGVNRHDFHPEYGHAVPRSVMEDDIRLLRANNITSVRTAHYPGARCFYELCDEYGILVMSECNLETHGLAKYIPADSPEWLKHCNYRLTNMIDSFKNHACVIFWSLGNEAGTGSVFESMKATAKSLDDTRPIHYEPDNRLSATDILSEMYAPLDKMPKIGKGKPIIHSRANWNDMMGYLLTGAEYKNLPYIQCEYAHAMGNSLGNFVDYQREFEKYDRLAGGYIWDFADQAILIYDKLGNKKYCCGGDFFDKPNYGIFAFNGIVRADRSPNPALYEVKAAYTRVFMTYADSMLRLKNRFMFIDLNEFYLKVSLYCGGVFIKGAEIELPSIKPDEEKEIKIPFSFDCEETLNGKPYKEKYITAELIAKENNTFAGKGYVAARGQFITEESDFSLPKNAYGKVHIDDGDEKAVIYGERFSLTVDKKSGAIISFEKDGRQLLSEPITPNFWRAPIDNDTILQVPILSKIFDFQRYKKAMKKLKPLKIDVKNDGEAAEISIKWFMPNLISLKTTYKIYGDGSAALSMSVRSFINLIRYGFKFSLTDGIKNIRFYGKGPHENYIDRNTSALLGIYEGSAEDFIHDYLHPQENGNHTG
ncbi:MAG: DUF4981 domain-containing protein, partial [Clostridiales bacterium]|nr:DUF4981 domain-containing protein [Clostridiales bacterium]